VKQLIHASAAAAAVALVATLPALAAATAASPAAGTTAAAAPPIVQFGSVPRFWCLAAFPGQAQTTIGWSVPTATSATVLLDGQVLHQGIRKQLPFAVLAGKADGLGVTVVFGCATGRSHRVTIRWRNGDSPASHRTITIRKAQRA
jgi:hypothetical protein